MELELTEDQAVFVATTRRFLAAEARSAPVRALSRRPRRLRSRGRGARARRWGGPRCWCPEADGGGSLSEHGLLDLVLVAEEMGRVVAPGPLVPVNVVAAALAADRAPPRSAPHLPGLLAGDAVAAWSGPGPSPPPQADDGGSLLAARSPRWRPAPRPATCW